MLSAWLHYFCGNVAKKINPCFSPVAPRGLRQDLHGWGREEIEEEADRMSKGIKGIRTSAASLRMLGVPHPRLQAPPVLSDKLIPPLDAAASSLSVLPSTEVRAALQPECCWENSPGSVDREFNGSYECPGSGGIEAMLLKETNL